VRPRITAKTDKRWDFSKFHLKTSATAPGKVVLLGEYSVLEGAPALSIAVDRGVRVDINPVDTRECRAFAAAVSQHPARFAIGDDGRLLWLDENGPENFGLLKSVVDSLSALGEMPGLAPENTFDISLDSTELYYDVGGRKMQKLGLGSSAALTVALVHAVREYSGGAPLDAGHWLPVLVEIHRTLQAGRGSGVDIASSLYGGVIEYRLLGANPSVNRLTLPGELKHAFVWSGRSASTSALLQKLVNWRDQNTSKFINLMDQMGAASADGVAAVKAGNCESFLASVSRFGEFLDTLGCQAGLGIFSPPHRALSALAMKSGLVYKPCGAGSGDLGVAMGTNVNDIDQFVIRARSSGYKIIDISPNSNGVQTIRS
jgi:phosphomevalonate kinase